MKPSENKNMDKSMDVLAIVGNSIIAAIAFILAYTGLPAEAVTVFAVLMIVDYISGVFGAIAVGTPVTSRKMKIGVISKALTLMIPFIMAAVFKVTTVYNMNPIVDFVLSVFIFAEAYSILSNMHAVKHGEYLPEFEVIALLGKKLRKIIDNMLDSDK